MSSDFVHADLDLKNVTVHYVHIPVEKPRQICVLVHGWPEFWFCWHKQMKALAKAGIWAIAVDMRGFGDTRVLDKPDSVASYTFDAQCGDMSRLLDHLGVSKAVFIGHDCEPSTSSQIGRAHV